MHSLGINIRFAFIWNHFDESYKHLKHLSQVEHLTVLNTVHEFSTGISFF